MKLKELEQTAKDELSNEVVKYAKILLQDKYKEVKQAKKVYETAQKEYNALLEIDTDDMEIEDFEY